MNFAIINIILSPKQFYPEKFREGTCYIESECFKRGTYFVRMQARTVAFAGAFGIWTV